MKKKITIITLCLATLIAGEAAAQKKQKAVPFKLSGTIRNFTGKTLYVHHIWEEKEFTDSMKVTDGKFSIELKSPESNMYWINTAPFVNAPPNVMFFSDPKAEIKASIHADSIPFAVITGGPSQKDYTDYKAMLNGFVSIQQKMQAAYTEAMQKGDAAAMETIRNDFHNLNNDFINGMSDFVKQHPKSPVSGYIVYNDMNNPAVPFEKVVESLGAIDKSMAQTKFVILATKRVEGLKGTMIGFKATNFTQNDPDGKPVKLSDFTGKYVLVDFWASWCGPCRMENPNVVSAYNKYKDKGFTVLGVSFDNNKEKWLEAVQKDGLTWSHVSDLKGWGNEAGKIFSITSIPQNLLLDTEGKIVAKNLRGAALEEKLAEIIK